MYLHKENRELFCDVILLASQKLDVLCISYRRKGTGKLYIGCPWNRGTLKLISDSLEYEMLKNHYRELAEKIFAR